MDVILTANSPGEVAAWLTPTVKSVRRLAPQCTISVFVPPCTFASGAECAVVATMADVDAVYGPREFVRFVLWGIRPEGFRPGKTGLVCFLGGDLLSAVLLSRRLGLPAVAYTEGRVGWHRSYRQFFLPDEGARRRALDKGARPEQLQVIGDLMQDAVRPICSSRNQIKGLLGIPDSQLVVSLFPGSRPFELRHMLPFFLRAAERLAQEVKPSPRFLMSVAPFADDETFVRTVKEGSSPQVQIVAMGPLAPGSATSAWWLHTDRLSVAAYKGLQYDIMLASDLALTVPGSNTAEMAFLGLPMVVVLPLNQAEEIPLEGVAGLIGRLPLVGRPLKRAAVLAAAERVQYAALPNRKAERLLVPEVRGHIEPEDVLAPALTLLREPEKRQEIGRQLREVMGEAGASDRLAEGIVATANGSYGGRRDET